MESIAKQPCPGRRRDGQHCTATPLGGGPFCFTHDPQREQERDAARRKGGRNWSNTARLMPPRLVPIFDRLESALEETHSGDLDPKVATAMASLARALVAVCTTGELEERLRKLEQQGERQ